MLLSLPASAALPRSSITLPQGRFGAIQEQIGDDSAISLALRSGQPSSMTVRYHTQSSLSYVKVYNYVHVLLLLLLL